MLSALPYFDENSDCSTVHSGQMSLECANSEQLLMPMFTEVLERSMGRKDWSAVVEMEGVRGRGIVISSAGFKTLSFTILLLGYTVVEVLPCKWIRPHSLALSCDVQSFLV